MGHVAKDCKNKKGGDPHQYSPCKICKKSNHLEKDCYFRDRHQRSDKQDDQKVCFLTTNMGPNGWILDSGSTSHMVNDARQLEDYKEIEAEVGSAKKNELMKAVAAGKVDIGKCMLEDVLFVPDLRQNLISVDAITRKGGGGESFLEKKT